MKAFASVLLLFLLCVHAVHAQSSLSFYVSPDGRDSNPGTLGLPFRTIEEARDIVRALDSNMQGNITVYLREGTYELQNTLAFDQRDSGSNGFYVIYRNYPGENPIISGGRQITGWVQEGDKWKAYVGTSMQTRQLYVNGNRAVRARSEGGLPGALKTATGYTTTDASMQNWGNIKDIEFVGKACWKILRCGVQSISGTAITMKQPCWENSQNQIPCGLNNPDWIENAYELLDSPGEWYMNRQTGWIYYEPQSEENMTTAIVIAPVLETLVSGNGTYDNPIHNIQFQGITFAYATWLEPNTEKGYATGQSNILWDVTNLPGNIAKTPANIAFTVSRSIIFERDVFIHLGATGLEFGDGSKDTVVSGCHFLDISCGGIQIVDLKWWLNWNYLLADPTKYPDTGIIRGNRITNNYIHDVAVEYQGCAGIFLTYAQNSTISHNELANLPHTAISIGWGWGNTDPSFAKDNKIQNNFIHDHVKVLRDGGGIYSLSAQPGNIISGNLIENQVNNQGAIYLDDGSRYITIFDNVIFNNSRTLLIKGGDHYIHDNWWQDRVGYLDMWFHNTGSCWNDSYKPPYCCGPYECGLNRIENNHNIMNLNEAPASILQNAGLEPGYIDIKTISPPSNIQTTCNLATGQVALSWNAAPGAATYLLRVDDTTNNGPGASYWYKPGSTDLATETSATQYNHSIKCGIEYNFWIHSMNMLGYGNASGLTFICPCFVQSDLNHDGKVNQTDFQSLKSSWGSSAKPPADLNQDGTVNSVDLGILLSEWSL